MIRVRNLNIEKKKNGKSYVTCVEIMYLIYFIDPYARCTQYYNPKRVCLNDERSEMILWYGQKRAQSA